MNHSDLPAEEIGVWGHAFRSQCRALDDFTAPGPGIEAAVRAMQQLAPRLCAPTTQQTRPALPEPCR